MNLSPQSQSVWTSPETMDFEKWQNHHLGHRRNEEEARKWDVMLWCTVSDPNRLTALIETEKSLRTQ